MTDSDLTAEYYCVKCSAPHIEKVKFCPSCGEIQLMDESTPYIWKYLLPVFIYYGLVLSLLAVLAFSDFEVLEGAVIADIAFSGITLVFASIHFSSLKKSLSFKGFNFLLAALVTLVSFLFAVTVFVLLLWLKDKLHISDHGIAVYESLGNYSYPLLLTLLTMAVQPALFEEIAFRGFIFNNLLRMSSPFQTIIITSFMFGIIHLSPISLIWMIPLALFYAYLRQRTSMIWYGVLAHFIHNSTVVLLELLHSETISF